MNFLLMYVPRLAELSLGKELNSQDFCQFGLKYGRDGEIFAAFKSDQQFSLSLHLSLILIQILASHIAIF